MQVNDTKRTKVAVRDVVLWWNMFFYFPLYLLATQTWKHHIWARGSIKHAPLELAVLIEKKTRISRNSVIWLTLMVKTIVRVWDESNREETWHFAFERKWPSKQITWIIWSDYCFVFVGPLSVPQPLPLFQKVIDSEHRLEAVILKL